MLISRIIEIAADETRGFGMALAVAQATQSMPGVVALLERHAVNGGIETNDDMITMLEIYEIASQFRGRSEGAKVAFFNTNYDQVKRKGYSWSVMEQPLETFARMVGMPDWAIAKVANGDWNPSGKKPAPKAPVEADVTDLVTRTKIDKGIFKCTNTRTRVVHYEVEGEEEKFPTLGAAREFIGRVIEHPQGAGVKTNDPDQKRQERDLMRGKAKGGK